MEAIVETETLSPERRTAILSGAATVFARDGYEGASMSRIAAEAGVSKGSLYNYFDGKAALFTFWVAGECQCSLARIFDGQVPDGDPATGLRTVGERMLRMMVSHTGLTIYRLTVAEASKFPELARAFYDSGPARAIRTLSCWLQLQCDSGHLRIDDTEFAAEQFFSLCQARVAMRRRLGLMPAIDDGQVGMVVDQAVHMFLSLYGATK